ncbi:MAG: hypothetical protein ABI867_35100 [Kofleriaceae bacterium]
MKFATAAVLLASTTARADTAELSEKIRALTSDNYRATTVGKLMSFRLGGKCWAKLTQDSRPTGLIGSSTRYVVDFAKAVTGDDWSALEGSGTTEKAKNRASVEAKVAAFKPTFSYAISVDGDDCDDGRDPLWLQYHTHALQYLSENVPAAKRATIKIEVSSKAKTFSASVDKTGTVFTFVGPKEVAPAKWQDEMLATFKKAARK